MWCHRSSDRICAAQRGHIALGLMAGLEPLSKPLIAPNTTQSMLPKVVYQRAKRWHSLSSHFSSRFLKKALDARISAPLVCGYAAWICSMDTQTGETHMAAPQIAWATAHDWFHADLGDGTIECLASSVRN